MIEISLSEETPQLKETALSDGMKQIAEILHTAIQQNFIEGGRPEPWQPLKRPNKYGGILPLWGNGGLYRAVESGSGEDYAFVTAPDTIHEKGGRIPAVSLDPMGGRVMVFVIDGHTIFTYRHKAFDIAARHYMVIPDEERQQIYHTLTNAIITGVQYV